jgi:N12 class adenine-specific DNA methylase
LPTSIPRDIILNSASDIGATAGAATRFDANLDALRTLKVLEAEGRQATPPEQATLAKYSGFGDGAFNTAFSGHARGDDAWRQRGNKLRELLTEDEYQSIERSRLNAFYTSPEVIKATWTALERLGAGNIAAPRILEPSAGSGRFLGFQPTESAARSQRIAVELDQMTAKILKHCYPQTEVYAMGYEKAPIGKENVDIAISNVPFGDYPIHDPTFTKQRRRLTRQIHNYFFAKALEHLRPGGMLAFVTSHNTLDAPSAKPVREALAQQADLVGAMRLPKTAFPDTEVVTDVVFMRKRIPGEQAGDISWVNSDVMELPVKEEGGYRYNVKANVNRYFLEHPEMVLGEHSASGSMYRGDEYTVIPRHGEPLGKALYESINRLPQDVLKDDAPKTSTSPRYIFGMPSAVNLHEGSRVIGDDGQTIYVKRQGSLAKADMTAEEQARVKQMLAVRDAARATLDTQLREAENMEVAKAQESLRNAYDSFATTYGPLNTAKNADLMRGDPDGALLRALEKWNAEKPRELERITPEQTNAKEFKNSTSLTMAQADRLKMPIFTQRVVKGMGERAINTESDAEAVSLNETGRLDFKRMGELLGKSETEVRDSLASKRLIFKNPIGDWEPSDKYLSGDVREKLKTAEAAASANPKYKPNVEALKAVQPTDLTPGQIGVSLGMPWIPQDDVNDFVRELLQAGYMRGQPPFEYVEKTGEWIKGESRLQAPYAKLTSEWGTERMPANELIYRILNSKMVEVVDKSEGDDGKEVKVRNPVETIAAQEKAAAIEARFREWIWENPERTNRLAELYNNTFNTIRPRRFDGAHQELPGMSTKWAKQIHPHQKDAIWRVAQDRTALLAHEVGFGKTAVMVGAGMELRRLGLSQKNMYVVPKATHEQFYNQFREVYPYAKILYPEDADFTPERRSEFISRVATGDWDAVILSDTQFSRIPVKPETEAKFLKEEIADFRAALEAEEETSDDARHGYGRRQKESRTHKELQKALVRMEERLQETLGRIGQKQEQTIHFEDLAVDQLFVDEADMFKNLHFATRMGRVKGLPNGKSDRAFDMYEKCRYLQEQGGGQGVVFATGTPVANTIAEMYTMMRYLQQPMLEAKGLQHFDAWAKTFGETTESLEQNAAGQYKLTQRFSKFVNTPELSNMWQQVADIRVADESPTIVAQRPRLVDEQGKARRTVVSCPPDNALLGYMKYLEQRADEMGGKDPREDNMLKLASDARKASLDMRMVDSSAPFNPEGKVGKAAQKISEIYHTTAGNKGTQLVFLDLGTPKAKEKVDATETEAADEEGEETAEEKKLLQNVYRVLKERIVAAGIPEKEIAFIHEAKTNEQKKRLFDRVNSGDIRVIVGSTSKLGTGVNVQERAAALHHLDAPWRPRDIEQREGRLIRQGNKVYGPKMDKERKVVDAGPGVRVYTYVTERSFDAFMWQAIEAKSKAIKAIMRRENPPRAVEDIDSFTMSAGEAKAIASGNPDIMKAVTLKNDITKLQMLRGSHTDARARARGQLEQLPREIKEVQDSIAKLEKDVTLAKVEAPFAVKVGSQSFVERPAAGEALKAIIANIPEITDPAKAPQIAKYKGFDVKVFNQGPGAGYQLLITNPATGYTHATTVIPYSELTGAGTLQRIENKVAGIPAAVGTAQKRMEQAQSNLKTYQKQAEIPFEHQERLDKLAKQLAILERKLQGQEVPSEELATVSDIISEPEVVEPSPVYKWGAPEGEQRAEEAKELVKVEREALKEVTKPDIATPNVSPEAEAQKPPMVKDIEVKIEKPEIKEVPVAIEAPRVIEHKPQEVKQPTIKQPYRVQASREGKTVLEGVKAKPIILVDGIAGFIHRPLKIDGTPETTGWVVSDPETGQSIATAYRGTQEDVIEDANKRIKKFAEMRKITPKELMAETITKAKAKHPGLYGEAPKITESKVEPIPEPPKKEKGQRKPRIIIEKPKAIEPEPSKAKLTGTYVIDDKRSPHAIRIDQALQAKDVVDKRNKEGVSRWRSHPNQMDVRGIDTMRTKAPRFKGGRVVIDTRGHKHRQKRGSILP